MENAQQIASDIQDKVQKMHGFLDTLIEGELSRDELVALFMASMQFSAWLIGHDKNIDKVAIIDTFVDMLRHFDQHIPDDATIN